MGEVGDHKVLPTGGGGQRAVRTDCVQGDGPKQPGSSAYVICL